MPITVVCTNCGRSYAADESLAGRRVRCRGCGNIVEIPRGEDDAPDLESLAGMERTFSGGDALMATQMPPSSAPDQPQLPAGMEDVELSGAGIEAAGRANVRFNFLGAKALDELLPWGLVLASLLWLIVQTIRNDNTGKIWITITRVAILILLYAILVAPVTFAALRKAGRKVGFQLPRSARWRTFACYMPAITLTAGLWMMGYGSMISFIMGLLAGLMVSSACLWVLFRLTPEEAPPTAGYGAAGFAIGAIVSAGILVGLNAVVKSVVESTNAVAAVPGSPFGSGFDLNWPKPGAPAPTDGRGRRTPPQPSGSTGGGAISLDPGASPAAPTPTDATGAGPINPPKIELPTDAGAAIIPPPDGGAAGTGAGTVATSTNLIPAPTDGAGVTTPGTTTDGTTPLPGGLTPGGVPPAVTVSDPPTSALIASFTPAPIAEPIEDFVTPMSSSPHVAAARRAADNLQEVVVWNSESWQQKGAAKFKHTGMLEPHVISPNGDWLARIVQFPRLAVEVWSVPQNRMDKLIDLDNRLGRPQVLGFLTGDRVVVRWDGGSTTQLDVIDVVAGRSVRRRPLALPVVVGSSNNCFAFSPQGKFIAVTAKVDNEPTLLVYASEGDAEDRPSSKIKLPLAPQWPAEPTGMAFVPDAADKRNENIIALMFEQSGSAMLMQCRQDGNVIGKEQNFPAGPPAPRPAFFTGSSVQWLTSGKNRFWLVYGTAVIDPATGQSVGGIDVKGVERCSVVDPTTLLYVTAAHGGTGRNAFRAKLDLSSLK